MVDRSFHIKSSEGLCCNPSGLSHNLPDYFEALNMEYRYQLKVIGSFAQGIVKSEVQQNQFVIALNQPNTKVSWQVTGIRQDAWARKNRIPNAVEKEAANRGKYLHPEVFNQPASKAIGYASENEAGISSLNHVAPVASTPAAPAAIKGSSLEQAPIQRPAVKATEESGSLSPASKKEAARAIAPENGSSVNQ